LEKRFENVHFDAVYSSDLERTKKTASAIYLPQGLELTTLPELREVNMGAWEDVPWGDIEKYSPAQLTYFNSDPEKWSIEGHEAFDDLKKRMTETILELAEKHDGGTIAVVSHGSAIRTFLCGALGIRAADIIQIPHCDNTAVTLLNVENGHIEVEYMGDNSHLPPGCSTFARQKWHKVKSGLDGSNLRFVPMDLERDRQRYLDYRRDAWLIAHGTAEGFKEEYLDLARRHMREHPRALSLALQGDRPTGLVELSVNRGAAEKIGTIEFYYMEKPYRGTGMSVQLLARPCPCTAVWAGRSFES
jgi:probable phosphoglycerate mutase